jgi:hypothetical protein
VNLGGEFFAQRFAETMETRDFMDAEFLTRKI